MLRRSVLLLVVLSSPAFGQRQSTFNFSIKNIMRGPELYGRPPGDVRWSNDSKWIYFTWLEPGTDWREFDSAGAIVTTGERSKNGRYMAVEFNGDLYLTDLQSGTTRRFTQTVAREHDPEFAVDAKRLFFVRDDNVYSIDLNGGLLQQLTDIRAGPEPTDSAKATGQRGRLEQQQRDLFEVIRDRIRAASIRKAEEKEVAGRALKTYYTQRGENIASLSVAPTGKALLIRTRIPPTGAKSADLIQFVTESGYPEVIRGRTNVGDVQLRGRLGFLSLPSGTIKWLNAFPTDTANGFVQVLGWSDDGARAAFYACTGDRRIVALHQFISLKD